MFGCGVVHRCQFGPHCHAADRGNGGALHGPTAIDTRPAREATSRCSGHHHSDHGTHSHSESCSHARAAEVETAVCFGSAAAHDSPAGHNHRHRGCGITCFLAPPSSGVSRLEFKPRRSLVTNCFCACSSSTPESPPRIRRSPEGEETSFADRCCAIGSCRVYCRWLL